MQSFSIGGPKILVWGDPVETYNIVVVDYVSIFVFLLCSFSFFFFLFCLVKWALYDGDNHSSSVLEM
jgi:hypothetical protein